MRAESISSWMNLTVCPFFKVISLGSRWVCAWIPVKVRAQELAAEVVKCKTDDDARQLGIEWGIQQARELYASGITSIHFFTVSAVDSVVAITKALL